MSPGYVDFSKCLLVPLNLPHGHTTDHRTPWSMSLHAVSFLFAASSVFHGRGVWPKAVRPMGFIHPDHWRWCFFSPQQLICLNILYFCIFLYLFPFVSLILNAFSCISLQWYVLFCFYFFIATPYPYWVYLGISVYMGNPCNPPK